MSAVLKFERVPKPVTRPVYVRPDLLSFPADWIKANHDRLVERFGDGLQEDWDLFCRDQHHRACNEHDQFKETYRGP